MRADRARFTSLILLVAACVQSPDRGSPETGVQVAAGGMSGTGANPVTGGTTGAAAGGITGGIKGTGGSADARHIDVGGSDPFARWRQVCVDKINAFRATEGKPPYERWTDAEACTDAEAKSDSETKKAHGAFGRCAESAQNECPNWGSDVEKIISGCLQSMWNEGPGEPFEAHGHYLNMSSTKYKRVACGFHLTADGKLWAIQNFK